MRTTIGAVAVQQALRAMEVPYKAIAEWCGVSIQTARNNTNAGVSATVKPWVERSDFERREATATAMCMLMNNWSLDRALEDRREQLQKIQAVNPGLVEHMRVGRTSRIRK